MAIHASLRMGVTLSDPSDHDSQQDQYLEDDMNICLLLIIDLYSTIKLYHVSSEITELIFSINLTELRIAQLKDEEYDTSEVPEVEISSVELLMRAKMLMITTRDNQIYFMSPEFELKLIKLEREPEDEASIVSESLIFECNDTLFLCLGFSNGTFIIENFVTAAKKSKLHAESIIKVPFLTSKITSI